MAKPSCEPSRSGPSAARKRVVSADQQRREQRKKTAEAAAARKKANASATRRPDGWENMDANQKRAAIAAQARTRKLDMKSMSKEAVNAAFDRMDSNGNGGLSLAEIDKAVIELYPGYDHKPALMRAYKAADVSGDGFIGRREFRKLLHYLVYFNDLFEKFEDIDSDHDRKLSLVEFSRATALVGHPMPPEEVAAEFAEMDGDGGGCVLFDEFCVWCAHRHLGEYEDGDEELVESSTRSMWRGMYSAAPGPPKHPIAKGRQARSIASDGTSYANKHGFDPVKNPPRNRRSDWAFSAGHPVYAHQPKNPTWHHAAPGRYDHSSDFDQAGNRPGTRWNTPTGFEATRDPAYIRAARGSASHIGHYDLPDLSSDAEGRAGTATPGMTPDRRGRFSGHGSLFEHTDHEGAEGGLELNHTQLGSTIDRVVRQAEDSRVVCTWAG